MPGLPPVTRRRFILATGIALAVMGTSLSAGDARAGPPVREENGFFTMLDADVYPPQASVRRRPRGLAIDLHGFSGNTLTGEPQTGLLVSRSNELRFPRGLSVNFGAFPACREDALRQRGPSACPRRSRIARGRSVIDARPAIPDLLGLEQAAVFNGRDSGGSRAILLWGRSSFGVSGVIPFQIKRPGRTGGWRFVSDLGPRRLGPGTVTLAVVGHDLSFPDSSVRVRGKRVHLFEAPRRCRRFWSFQFITTRYNGRRVVASDRVPCTRR